uniref:Reverse transcriptase zinc-binding domain-containing protein n=1 Tax=Cajanus cajan TaxID=3821 RepID=A0A151RY59_CAJCA|nr:hypothetical protein KK1_030889 [Cajanus cajan]
MRCGDDVESVDHVFRSCAISWAIWYLLLLGSKHRDFFGMDIKHWMLSNLNDKALVVGREWCLIFAVTLDILWQYRNRVTFQGSSSHPHELVSRILAQVNILQDSIPLFRCQTIATTNKRINR